VYLPSNKCSRDALPSVEKAVFGKFGRPNRKYLIFGTLVCCVVRFPLLTLHGALKLLCVVGLSTRQTNLISKTFPSFLPPRTHPAPEDSWESERLHVVIQNPSRLRCSYTKEYGHDLPQDSISSLTKKQKGVGTSWFHIWCLCTDITLLQRRIGFQTTRRNTQTAAGSSGQWEKSNIKPN